MPSEDTKILEFNQYQKYDKTRFIIYADLEFIRKRLMDIKTIMKIHLHQKQANIFHQVFQCPQYRQLEAEKISTMYTEVKIA